MLRIVTVSIIGCIMLALATMAGYELTKEPPTLSVEIQQNAEVINKQDDSAELSKKKAASLAAAKRKAARAAKSAPSDPKGVLVPLDEGTVRADAKVERRSLPSVTDTSPSNETKQDGLQAKAPIKIAPTERKRAQAPAQIPASASRAKTLAGSLSSPIPAPNIPPFESPAIVPDVAAAVVDKDGTLIPAKELVVFVTDTPSAKGKNQNTITRMRLEVGPSRVALRCIGDAPLKASYFVLTDPPRFVLDLRGDWAFQLPRIPKNTLLKSFRRGKQAGGTRIVFDLFRVPSIAKVLQTNETTIEARLF